MTGTGTLPNGDPFQWSATRVPGSETRPSVERDGPESRPDSRPEEPPKVPEQFGYPFGPYAREKLPEQPETVLFAGATVWTSGKDGIIENGLRARERAARSSRSEALKPSDVPADAVVVDVEGQAHHARHHRLPLAHRHLARRQRRRPGRHRRGAHRRRHRPRLDLLVPPARRRRHRRQQPARLGQPDRRAELRHQAPLGRHAPRRDELRGAPRPASSSRSART